MGGSCTDIATHRPAVELPERPLPPGPKSGVTHPELSGQIADREAMAFQATANGQPPQRQRGGVHGSERRRECLNATGSGVNLEGFRAELL